MSNPVLSPDWSLSEATHLLNRAGFGGPPEDIQKLHSLGKRVAVRSLLYGDEDSDLFPPPALTPPEDTMARMQMYRNTPEGPGRMQLFKEQRLQQRKELNDLTAWWLQRMRYTSFPLREKMTLFWHGHFATSFQKVKEVYPMWQQNETLRAHALGNFQKLTEDITRDPAMMIYLDLIKSRPGQPNENFARELMELFTLGEGVRYEEKDIKEAAKAFAGYRFDRRTLAFLSGRSKVDVSTKSFLGRTGKFEGDDIVRVICEQADCAKFISGKIWKFLAGTDAAPGLQVRLTNAFLSSKYNISALLEAIFLSPDFYAPAVVGEQIKSPVQWLVEMSRTLEAPLPPQHVSNLALRQLGQVLFVPPNVKGWEGGTSWINGSTFLLRCNLAGVIINGQNNAVQGVRGAHPLDVPWEKVAPRNIRNNPAQLCDNLALRLLNAPLEESERSKFVSFLQGSGPTVDEAAIRDLVHLIMSTPEYQLT